MNGNPRIEGAGERWKNYRKDLTAYILQDSLPEERLLIIGAGACDDLEIAALAEASGQIFLLDCNSETMEAAVCELPEVYRESVYTKEADISALSEKQVTEFIQACVNGEATRREWLETYIRNYQSLNPLEQAMEQLLDQYGGAYFDKIICIGVHSQIYMPLVLAVHEQDKPYSRMIRLAMQEMLEELNRYFAEESLAILHRYGRKLYLGYEYTTFSAAEAALQQEAIECLQQEGSAGLHRMQLPRVEGAFQLEQAIGQACYEQRFIQQSYAYMLWPFSEEKSYLMVIFAMT